MRNVVIIVKNVNRLMFAQNAILTIFYKILFANKLVTLHTLIKILFVIHVCLVVLNAKVTINANNVSQAFYWAPIINVQKDVKRDTS